MIEALLVIHLLIAAAMVGVVLLQKSEGGCAWHWRRRWRRRRFPDRSRDGESAHAYNGRLGGGLLPDEHPSLGSAQVVGVRSAVSVYRASGNANWTAGPIE